MVILHFWSALSSPGTNQDGINSGMANLDLIRFLYSPNLERSS